MSCSHGCRAVFTGACLHPSAATLGWHSAILPLCDVVRAPGWQRVCAQTLRKTPIDLNLDHHGAAYEDNHKVQPKYDDEDMWVSDGRHSSSSSSSSSSRAAGSRGGGSLGTEAAAAAAAVAAGAGLVQDKLLLQRMLPALCVLEGL